MSKAKPTSRSRQGRSVPRTRRKQGGMNQEAKVLLGMGLVALLFIVVAALLRPGTPPAPPVAPETLVRPDSPILGAAAAPVTIVEFLDPECESCRAMYPIVKELLEHYGEDVRLVVRYFPLHANSVLAAAATEAAGEQGKYWEMQELLFARQPEWGEQQTPQTELLIGYARELGLDEARFVAAMENPAIRQKIERDRTDGLALQVTGTPSFFVNGQPVAGELGPTSLEAAIKAALQGR